MQLLLVQLTLGYIATSTAFTGNALAVVRPRFTSPTCRWNAPPKSETEKAESNEDDIMNTTSKVQEEEEVPAVGNLVADEEWEGLTLELTELVRKSCESRQRPLVAVSIEVIILHAQLTCSCFCLMLQWWKI